MEDFIHDCLWLPFQEPAFLWHDDPIDEASLPVFHYEDPDQCLKLARLWDARGVLALFDRPAQPGMLSRVFQIFKNSTADRQIGDHQTPRRDT